MYCFFMAGSSWLAEFWQSFTSHFLEEFKIGDIGEEINHGILQWKSYLDVGNTHFLITDAVIVMWIALLVIFLICLWGVKKCDYAPTKRQTIMELVYGLIISSSIGFGMREDEAKKVAPMIATFGLVIASCNIFSYFKLPPPAKNIAFPAAMGLIAIVYVIGVSIKFVGFKGFWGSLVQPMAPMLPFKILDLIIKPVSLALRLFGNVFGSFVFMEFLFIIVPVFIPAAFGLWFDVADGVLQAVVFSYLTMSYIGEITEVGHEYIESEEERKNMKKAKLDLKKAAKAEKKAAKAEKKAVKSESINSEVIVKA
ncbi:MAG: F0F1 ATP synthase subunit A [Clostridia bacterium]|nr:F0F1 ATP synthase subunit A [Clostridia bacterium]